MKAFLQGPFGHVDGFVISFGHIPIPGLQPGLFNRKKNRAHLAMHPAVTPPFQVCGLFLTVAATAAAKRYNDIATDNVHSRFRGRIIH